MAEGNLDLARMHVAALYVHDAGGRLVSINERDPEDPAPRFFLARTRAGNLWRTRHDLPLELAAELERLAAAEPFTGDLDAQPSLIDRYTTLLQQHAPVSSTYAGPAYYLPEGDLPVGTVTITPRNATLLHTHYDYTLNHLADREPVVVYVADGVAVAACYSARITTQVAEAGVHTVEAYRGRGWATDTVRGWAASIRATGRVPLYSTWWANRASQAVARKLGAVQYAVEFSLT